MGTQQRFTRVINILFYTGFAIIVVFFAVIANLPHEDKKFDSESCYIVTEGCKYINERGEKIDITLPARIDTGDSFTTNIEYVIPEHYGTVYALCIRTSQQSIEVEYEGRLLYSYGTDKSKIPIGISPGSSWNVIRLPMDSAGKTVSMKITAFDKFYKGYVNEIYVGTKASVLFQLLKENLLNLTISVVVFLIGIILLVSSVIFNRSLKVHMQTRYIGYFAILLGLWLFSESKAVQFFIGNQLLSYFLTFLSLCTFIIPFLQYLMSIESLHYKKLIGVITCILIGDMAVVFLLQIFNVYQFYEMLLWILVLRIATVFIILALMGLELFKYKNKDIQRIGIGVILLGVCSILEFLKFQFSRSNTVGSFMKIGLLLFLIILAIEAIEQSIYLANLSREANYYQCMANTDLMTNSQNRTAYIRDIEALSKTEKWKKSAVIIADINNLKEINDSYGHHIGDDAIIRCSNCMSKAFSAIGCCYRIGGDEFACIIPDCLSVEVEDYLISFENICENQKSECSYLFGVAIGLAKFEESEDAEFEDIAKRADRNMYGKKQMLKKPNGTESK